MSFRCARCTQAFAAPAKPIRLVTEWRDTENFSREIAKELDVCVGCAMAMQADGPDVRAQVQREATRLMRARIFDDLASGPKSVADLTWKLQAPEAQVQAMVSTLLQSGALVRNGANVELHG